MERRKVTAIFIAFAMSASALPAFGAQSEWAESFSSKIRLIAPGGPPREDGRLVAGIDVHLDKGWKTYWTNPGIAGLPPLITFDGSKNLKNAEVLLPAPKRFVEGESVSVGYKASFVIPVLVTPADSERPVRLRLNMDYGVCETLCVPAAGVAELELHGDLARDGSVSRKLGAAFLDLPQPASENGPRVAAVETDAAAGDGAYLVRLAGLSASSFDVFGSPSGDVFLSIPRRDDTPSAKAGEAVFRMRLTTPDGEKAHDVAVEFVILNGASAFTQNWVLP